MAKAESNRNVAVVVQKTESPYTEYTRQSVALTTSWKSFTLTFTPTVDEANSKISFSLGTQKGKVWIDQVSLSK
jgi:hypothetical protein